jgi:hypothetical protein
MEERCSCLWEHPMQILSVNRMVGALKEHQRGHNGCTRMKKDIAHKGLDCVDSFISL